MYIQSEIARSAYQTQREIETKEKIIVGLNAFTGAEELEVIPPRLVPHPYDAAKRMAAEKRQIASLAKLKQERDNQKVKKCLARLKEAARDETNNHIPALIEAVTNCATVGEMCDVFREVFGEYKAYGTL